MSAGAPASPEEREQRLRLLDDEIGRKLAESAASGELASAPSFGKPLHFGDGYDETPAELRMAMKVLKDAGVLPPEVQLMQEIAALQQQLEALDPLADAAGVQLLRQRVTDKRQLLALALERLRASASL